MTPFLQWRRAAFEASRAAAPSVAGEPLQGAMAWFQVNCPTCRAALQVWLEAGRTTVQCSAPAPMTCTVLFDVHVDASAMPAAAAKPSRRKIHMQMAPKALTAYNLFMKAEMAAARQSLVGLHGRDLTTAAFARAASRWKDAAANPRNVAAAALVAQAAGRADDGGASGLAMMLCAGAVVGGPEDEEEYADAREEGGARDSDDDEEAFQDAREEAGDEAEGDAAMQQYADGGAADAARAAAGTREAHRTRTGHRRP